MTMIKGAEGHTASGTSSTSYMPLFGTFTATAERVFAGYTYGYIFQVGWMPTDASAVRLLFPPSLRISRLSSSSRT